MVELDRFERTTLEHAIRILMKINSTPSDDLMSQHHTLSHEAAECIREILDPTYIRLT